MGETRLQYLSVTARIMFISVMVWEIQSLQYEFTVQSRILDRVLYYLFLGLLTSESEKVFNMKVVDNFCTFPTVYRTCSYDLWSYSYTCFTALLSLKVTQNCFINFVLTV